MTTDATTIAGRLAPTWPTRTVAELDARRAPAEVRPLPNLHVSNLRLVAAVGNAGREAGGCGHRRARECPGGGPRLFARGPNGS